MSVGLTMLALAASASALTFTVDSPADDGDGSCQGEPFAGDSVCTLRDAVNAANQHLNTVDSGGQEVADEINFSSAVRGSIQLTGADLQITSDSLHINGPGADQLKIIAAADDRIFTLFGFGAVQLDSYDVTISGLTLTGGSPVVRPYASIGGGAILSTNDGFSRLEGRQICGDFAALTLIGMHITDNHTDPDTGPGGGIAVRPYVCFSDKAAPATEEGSLNVIDSTIDHNQSESQGGGIAFEDGNGGSLFVSNSTIANNVAGGPGGGISIIPQLSGKVEIDEPAGTYDVDNSTITENDAGASAGGGIYSEADEVGLRSTIVYGNRFTEQDDETTFKAGPFPNDLANPDGRPNANFTAGYSLLGTTDGADVVPVSGEPNLTGVDPQLGALANNGGPTPTKLPTTTSPAIDSGIGNGLTTDQRGLPRTVDRPPVNASDGTDIGAVELPAVPAGVQPEPEPEPTPLPGPAPQECLGKQVILTKGGDADEKLVGFGADDGIFGGGGEDDIDGLGGDDCLFGQVGDDTVVGGPGNDSANGDRDDDLVKGDGGADTVRGQNGDDRVFGGAGDDPKLTGGAGDDTVKGGDGADFIKGDGGNDVIIPGGGADFVHSGGGADSINTADHDRDTIICGTGKDVANVDPEDKVDKDCNTVNVVNGSRRPEA